MDGRTHLFKRAMQFVPIILGIAVAVIMIVVIWQRGLLNDIDISNANPLFIGLLLLSRIIYFTIMGAIIAVFVHHQGTQLGFFEWYALVIVGLFTNYITPFGGASLARAGYLKLKYRFPVSYYSAMLAANLLLNYFTSGLLGLVILLLISLQRSDTIPNSAMLLMAGVMIGPVIFILLPLEKLSLPDTNRFIRWIRLAFDGWGEMRKAPDLLWKQISLMFLLQFGQGISYALGLRAIGEQARFIDMLFISIITNIARVTPVRDIFGFREFVAGLGTWMIGEETSLGVTAAISIRLANLIVIMLLGPFFSYLLSTRLGSPLHQQLKLLREQIKQ